MRFLFQIVTSLLCLNAVSSVAAPKFEFRDEDRVAFVGGVFMEREQEDGYIETTLALSAPGNTIGFRNFGWGGDVVETHIAPRVPARPKYVPDLFAYLEKYKPTVVFIGYGMMESFRGEAGLKEFSANYVKVLERISAISKPRIVMVSPFRHEQLTGHFPEPTEHNRSLQLYVDASRKIAEERGIHFVDLFSGLAVYPKGRKQLTSNGVHLDSAGYKAAAGIIQKSLGLRSQNVKSTDFEKLRTAIRHKNRQWWFHYRPMNSEYVYPGGTRYQNDLGGIKHPMFSEIEAFAALTEKEEKRIQSAVKTLARGAGKAIDLSLKRDSSPNTPGTDPKVDPELERKSFTMAEGFEINLFAADPKISKPVQMAFDQRGRLWVATTTLYPQIKPGEEASDKIIILEDVDGDGQADKTTVFAEGLVIPTGVLPYKDGAFVFDDTTLLLLRDTDGDGRADKREVVLSGFGTEDSHHKGHTLRWGPEGRLHFNVGVFLHNNIETAHGVVSMSGYWQPGIFAYDPSSGRLDIHLANSVPPNPWGHYWNRWGFDFFIDSSGQQGSNFILPTSGRSSTALPVPGGEGKLAGGEIISGRHFPESWHGHLISAPFKENRVARWEFSDDGSGYGMKPLSPLIVSTDSAFRPVDERMGPDGAMYISDWYNPLIGHMQHHFRDPSRDFTHGRIWRIKAKHRPLVPRPTIAGASVKQLLEHLKAPEDYSRLQARRELAERPVKEVIPALGKWVKNLNTNDAGFDHTRLEALWVYQSLKVPEPALLKSLLRAKDGNARAAATVVMRDWRDSIPETMELISVLTRDEFPRVRLQAVIAASYVPDVRSVEAAMNVLDYPMDRYLEQALKNTIVALKPTWEVALAGDKMLFGGDAKRLSFLVKNAALESDPKVLIHLLRAKQVAPENLDKTITALANNGSKTDLEKLFVQDFAPGIQAKVLDGLTRAARERQIVLNQQSQRRLSNYLKHDDDSLRAAALRLAGAWKLEALRSEIETTARDEKASAQSRRAAFAGLAFLGGDSSKAFFIQRLQENKGNERQDLLSSFVDLDVTAAAQSTSEILSKPVQESELASLLQPFLQRKDGTDVLATAISEKPIHADNAKLALRFLQKAAREDKSLVAVLNVAAGSSGESKELSRQELEALAAEVLAKGDAVRGEQVFRRPELSCFQCHALSGAGGSLGPDLSAIGSGSKLDYLIESLLHPNKIVKDGFETVEVITTDDEYVLGIKVRETIRETVLKDAVRDEIIVPANSIKEQKHKPVSLMPAGLTAGLTHGEFLDLCRFLSELGKPGPFANNPNAIIRRWQIAYPTAEATVATAESVAWTPIYSTVSGMLPLAEFAGKDGKTTLWLRTQLQVTTPGAIQFHLNGTEGLSLYVNGKTTALSPNTRLELPQGRQTLLLEVDVAKRVNGLSIELEQIPGSPGRFQLVTGR